LTPATPLFTWTTCQLVCKFLNKKKYLELNTRQQLLPVCGLYGMKIRKKYFLSRIEPGARVGLNRLFHKTMEIFVLSIDLIILNSTCSIILGTVHHSTSYLNPSRPCFSLAFRRRQAKCWPSFAHTRLSTIGSCDPQGAGGRTSSAAVG
jgi:hypothetical protein